MIHVYICEDNLEQRKKFVKLIKNTILIEQLDMELVLETGSPYLVIDKVRNSDTVGLYFFDIDLQTDINGVQLAQEIRKLDPRGFIVFVTTHSEMSTLTFDYKVEALDFIIKDDMNVLNRRIQECILSVNERYTSVNNNVQKNFIIKINDKKIAVDYKDILFFETSSNIHKLILHAKNRDVEFIAKIKEVEAQLDERFYRCHRSYLVNCDNIKEVNYSERCIYMNDGQFCYISTRLLKGIKNKMKKGAF